MTDWAVHIRSQSPIVVISIAVAVAIVRRRRLVVCRHLNIFMDVRFDVKVFFLLFRSALPSSNRIFRYIYYFTLSLCILSE